MIDEAVLEDLLAEVGADIPVPARGADRVVDMLVNTTPPVRADRPMRMIGLLAAAAVVACIAIAVPLLHTSSSRTASNDELTPERAVASPATLPTQHAPAAGLGAAAPALPAGNRKIASTGAPGAGPSDTVPASPTSPTAAAGPVDGAKIVKTGNLDLQVPHATLRAAVNRVTGVAIGLGGYVADSKTTYGETDATAQITVRVPVARFDTAIAHLDALPDVKVLGESENGADVTGQYVDLQAQLNAATSARDAYLAILAHAQSLGDVLTVRDRLTSAQAEVDQLQGRINLLGDQASFSALAITLAEKPLTTKPAVVPHAKAETGLAKSWSDARHGFANVVEWLIARSGGALILLLAALALLFGVRYLYPVVRRGLV